MTDHPTLFDAGIDPPRKLRSPLAHGLPPHAPGSSTSRRAAECAAPKFSKRMRAYLDLLRDAGGLTDHEAAARLNRPVSGINSTRNRLMTLGLVRSSEREKLSPYGNWCTVWVTYEQALTEAKR